MGDTAEQHRCVDCNTREPTVTDRGTPIGPLCGRCWTGVRNRSDNDEALADGAAAPPPGTDPRCRHCAMLQERHETGYHRWVLLEPRVTVPWHIVPVGHRWVVTADRTAVNVRERALPAGALCRIPHHLVCPCGEPPSDALGPFYRILYGENQRSHDTYTSRWSDDIGSP